ncbi:unnamed protein product [Rotaria socialis]|uniref:Uncharacterized protein n=1 Tax=Rotaria socialis TaxID=392032 RepID=A0A818T804_9BILA|nr:unnamed protein product [Rotaria socialis]
MTSLLLTSTSRPIGWLMWRASSCMGSGDGGRISISSCKINSGENCYMSRCQTDYNFLGQSFSVTVGNTYRISFWYPKTGGDSGKFYVDIK